MSATATLTLGGLASEFGLLERKLADPPLEEALRAIVPNVQAGIALNFQMTQSPDGVAWPPRKSGGDWPLLIKTGEMFASVVEEGPGGSVEVTDSGLTLATDVDYAIFHENGTSRMAARPFMGLGQEALSELDEALADAILDELGVG